MSLELDENHEPSSRMSVPMSPESVIKEMK